MKDVADRLQEALDEARRKLETYQEQIVPLQNKIQEYGRLVEAIYHALEMATALPEEQELIAGSSTDKGEPPAIPGVPEDILSMPIERVSELSMRCLHALQWEQVTRVEQVLRMSAQELLSFRMFGRKTLQQLDEALDHLGYPRLEVQASRAKTGVKKVSSPSSTEPVEPPY